MNNSKTSFPCAILAGGLATRMWPKTETVPKSMLVVDGEPFIAHQLRLLKREGITKVVICAGYLSEHIRSFIGDGGTFDLQVDYSIDYPKLLGTGGALLQALPLLGSKFLVLYGDSYLDTSFSAVEEAFRNCGMPALMCVFRNEGKWDSSNVEFTDRQVLCYSKKERTPEMRYIDYGLSILSDSVFESWKGSSAFDLAEIYTILSKRKLLAGFEVSSRFYEIGSPSGLEETSQYLAGLPRK